MVCVNEVECRKRLRVLGIVTAPDWAAWCRIHPQRRRQQRLPLRPDREYGNRAFWKEFAGRYPRGWNRCQRLEKRRWLSYAAGFRVATGYHGMRFSGISTRLARGYAAACGVILACACLQLLWAGMGAAAPKAHRAGLMNGTLSARLRLALGRYSFNEGKLPPAFQLRLRRFLNEAPGDPEGLNVLIAAEAISYMFAHGAWMPIDAPVMSIGTARTLQDLADAILDLSESTFTRALRHNNS